MVRSIFSIILIIFCNSILGYFFVKFSLFCSKKGPKRGPGESLHPSLISVCEGYRKNRGQIFEKLSRRVWPCPGRLYPSQKSPKSRAYARTYGHWSFEAPGWKRCFAQLSPLLRGDNAIITSHQCEFTISTKRKTGLILAAGDNGIASNNGRIDFEI